MKKTLAVILAITMILSSFALGFGVFAAADRDGECTCDDCANTPGCHCCVYCPYLDITYLTNCVQDEHGNFNPEGFCCDECTGIWPCYCGHECCDPENDPHADGGSGPILTPNQQQSFIRGFQTILGMISDIFDRLFNALFEFLRLEDFLGN